MAAGIYFYYSLIYLVTRTVFLTIVVAKVHESSREPLIYLFAVPSYSYCVEVGSNMIFDGIGYDVLDVSR